MQPRVTLSTQNKSKISSRNGDIYVIVPIDSYVKVEFYETFEWDDVNNEKFTLISPGDLVLRVKKLGNEIQVIHPTAGIGWIGIEHARLAKLRG